MKKKKMISDAIDNIDIRFLEEYFDTKDMLAQKRLSQHSKRLLVVAAAVLCTALLFTTLLIPIMQRPDEPIVNGTESSESTNDNTVAAPSESETDNNEALEEDTVIPQNVVLLDTNIITSNTVNGTASKYTGTNQSSASSAPPAFRFETGGIVVIAKAIEELPNIYESLNAYGSVYTSKFRIFKMQVTDPLESGMSGEFYYALPSYLKGDLTKYDSLLISTTQTDNYILKNTESGKLTFLDPLFTDHQNLPHLGNMIAFSDGVFDESLWQDESWMYGYQFARSMLDEASEYSLREMLVLRGTTLDGAIKNLRDEWNTAKSYNSSFEPRKFGIKQYNADAAKDAAEYVKPFNNGVFACYEGTYRRYIGGCPTNEWIRIDNYTETVTRSEQSFSADELASLPDIALYIHELDLSSFSPQHTDTEGKELALNSAMGWYEKTDSGIYSIVKIAWRYYKSEKVDGYGYDMLFEYYDETFILLEEGSARAVSREELISLIGENQNIYPYEYGVPNELPLG